MDRSMRAQAHPPSCRDRFAHSFASKFAASFALKFGKKFFVSHFVCERMVTSVTSGFDFNSRLSNRFRFSKELMITSSATVSS